MRIIKIIIVLLFGVFVAVQFYQPQKNIGEKPNSLIFNDEKKMPGELKAILENSCFDCHSDNTRYPWYDRISPVSWVVNKHIENGKKELNFSDWESMDEIKKISTLEDIKQAVKKETMPLKSYLLIHSDAKLSEAQKILLIDWSDKKADEIINGL